MSETNQEDEIRRLKSLNNSHLHRLRRRRKEVIEEQNKKDLNNRIEKLVDILGKRLTQE